MLKPFIKLLLLVLLIHAAPISAQVKYLQQYVSRGMGMYYTRANFLTDLRFYDARHLKDTLNVEVTTAADLQSLIDAELNLKIYGVSVKADSAHITGVIAALKKFPQLKFMTFNEGPIISHNTKPLLLPENIKELQQLEGVGFSFTGINIPDALKKLAPLKNLQAIAFNAVTNTPVTKDLLSLKNIRFIKMSGSDINNLDISNAKWEYVDYGGSAPKTGVDGIALQKLAKVNTLKSLHISYYELGDDLSVFSKFTQLKTLEMWNTKIKPTVQLFEQLSKLKNLNVLSVRFYDDTTQTIGGIEKLVNLQQLNIEGLTSLKTIPKTIYGLKKLKSLTMQGYKFEVVPQEIFNMPELEYLDLSSNHITALPNMAKFGSYKLKTLKLSYNAIAALPDAIVLLDSLEILEANANKINIIPMTGWQRLRRFRALDLSMNQISTFPDGLQNNTNLEKLIFNNNQLISIPDLDRSNYNLKQLDLSSNELKALPAHIGKYAELEVLNIAGNRLSELPESLGNCTKLKEFEARSQPGRTAYDVNQKLNRDKLIYTKSDAKVNLIKALPVGLINTPYLEVLRLDNIPGIDAASVFNVILAMPRNYFTVSLEGDGITALPATDQWKGMMFNQLNLADNKLTTLPIQFALTEKFAHVSLYKNPLPLDPALINNDLNTKADLKILYDEMAIKLPDHTISKSDYAEALAKHVSDYYNKNQWQKAVSYADRGIAADSLTYGKYVRWDEIGICRFNLKDYTGAIRDFEHYIVDDAKINVHIINFAEPVGKYKAEAHLALNQLEKAAETHEYFWKTYHISGTLQRAALIYKQIGRSDKYKQLTDSALQNHKLKLEAYAKQKHTDIGAILDYAEALIIAEKYEDAITLINVQDPKLFSGSHLSIKHYLMATAKFLTTPDQYQQIKKALTVDIEANGKIADWDFDMFNYWVNQTVKDPIKKSQIIALQNIAK